MKKYLTIAIVAVIILGAVAYLAISGRSMSDEDIIRNAFMGRGSAHCAFAEPETGEKIEMYFKSGKMRMDGSANGYEFSLILKDGEVYTWNDYEDYGIKFSVAESEEMEFALDLANKEKFIDEIKEYVTNCSRSLVSESVFDLPEGVEFYGMEEIILPEAEYHYEDLNDVEIDFESEEIDLDELESYLEESNTEY